MGGRPTYAGCEGRAQLQLRSLLLACKSLRCPRTTEDCVGAVSYKRLVGEELTEGG